MQKVVTLHPQQSNTYLAYFVKVTVWKISWKGYNHHSWLLTKWYNSLHDAIPSLVTTFAEDL